MKQRLRTEFGINIPEFVTISRTTQDIRQHIVCLLRILERQQKNNMIAGCSPLPVKQRLIHNPYTGTMFDHQIRAKLDLPVYTRGYKDPDAVLNTIYYVWTVTRSAILVIIRHNKLQVFAPFANTHGFRNAWWKHMRLCVDCESQTHRGQCEYLHITTDSLQRYKRQRLQCFGRRDRWNGVGDPSKWWSNSNIVCETPSANGWTDNMFGLLRYIVERVCETCMIPDCSFVINRRDHPQIRAPDGAGPPEQFVRNVTEGKSGSDSPFTPRALLPVLSFYTGHCFADIPMPTHEDWLVGTGKIFPPDAQSVQGAEILAGAPGVHPSAHTLPLWAHRKPTAIWRGSSTGVGFMPENQRVCLHQWTRSPQNSVIESFPLLDASITKVCRRDKIHPTCGVIHHDDPRYIQTASQMDNMAQCQYKYALYVYGHSAAARLGQLLLRGSLCIHIDPPDSLEPVQLWLSGKLRAADWSSQDDNIDPSHPRIAGCHMIRVKSDLSDLQSALLWCRRNDKAAEHIAQQGRRLALDLLGNESALSNYMQLVIHRIGDRQAGHTQHSPWFSPWKDRYNTHVF